MAQIVEIIAIGVATGDGENASPQDIRHRMGDLRRVAGIADQSGQRVDQAKTLVGGSQKEHPAVGTDLSTIEGRGDLLLADVWQRKWKQGIVVGSGAWQILSGAREGCQQPISERFQAV